jgi:hypothetical protein
MQNSSTHSKKRKPGEVNSTADCISKRHASSELRSAEVVLKSHQMPKQGTHTHIAREPLVSVSALTGAFTQSVQKHVLEFQRHVEQLHESNAALSRANQVLSGEALMAKHNVVTMQHTLNVAVNKLKKAERDRAEGETISSQKMTKVKAELATALEQFSSFQAATSADKMLLETQLQDMTNRMNAAQEVINATFAAEVQKQLKTLTAVHDAELKKVGEDYCRNVQAAQSKLEQARQENFVLKALHAEELERRTTMDRKYLAVKVQLRTVEERQDAAVVSAASPAARKAAMAQLSQLNAGLHEQIASLEVAQKEMQYHAAQEKISLEQKIRVLETDNRHLQATTQQITEESEVVIHELRQKLSLRR